MKSNHVRRAIKAGECVVGTMISEMLNPEVAYILATAGMDFLMVDCEHSAIGFESIQNIMRAARAAGLVPLARVTQNDYPFIARILDIGAMGIMVPRVNTAEEARRVVRCAKYPPLGERGFGARGVITDYEAVSVREVIEWVNEHTLIIVQVESAKAVENLEEITRVPGIDIALIGPNDLSVSLGVPGEFTHPRFLEAVERTFEICLRNGVSPAIHTGDLEAIKGYRDKGMRFLMVGSESRLLLLAATDAVRQLVGEARKSGKAVY
jgi:2-dehydro-3-deoxyglucarate aldolase/4-hydroxy-2-oxoheptanedioate aldolase